MRIVSKTRLGRSVRWAGGSRWAILVSSLLCLGSLLAGCAEDDGESLCSGPAIMPHLSPIFLGEMYPLGNNQADPTGNYRTPYEWVLLLQSTCQNTVVIDRICIVGNAEKNGGDVVHFELEGPEPMEVKRGLEGAVRITYDRQQPNDEDDVDNVALVIQSNAKNHPTLVVPICARVVPNGTQINHDIECESPVEVPAGQRLSELCQ